MLLYYFILLLSNLFVTSFRFQNFLRVSSLNRKHSFILHAQHYDGNHRSKIKSGSLVEYVSAKGTKRICLVDGRRGPQLDVINETKKPFHISMYKVTYHLNGSFVFGDLLRINEILAELRPIQVERLWESMYARASIEDTVNRTYSIEHLSQQIFGVADPVRLYATHRLMNTFGSVFFSMVRSKRDSPMSEEYVPLRPQTVQENLRDRAALREFKQRFTKIASNKDKASGMPEIPERVIRVLESYSEGLKQLVAKCHPWTKNGLNRIHINATEIARGKELLEFLGLAPLPRNARKVLDMMGVWPMHANIEKYVMQLRDTFDAGALEEAQYLLDNAAYITDMDERIRRDLRHLRSYAIDREGASEVDDAVSIEQVETEDGRVRDKVWVHIADVSRWVRPGSQLSLEAERRMSSVYLPDERISMFPEDLSSQVLSLGASIDSFALSCGVVLSELGEIESFEVCPSKIRVTKKLSYAQLEEVLSKRDVHVASARLFEKFLVEDLNALNRWARVRHAYRVSNSALDVYMRDKTELYLSVKKDPKVPERRSLVSGYTVWTNGTSISLVSEYMILMSQTVGQYCAALDIPVLYKTQSPSTPLTSQDLLLQEGETPFIRATRLIKLVRPANDTRHPGRHCSSGANAYVQCTSPIRRYHDLYNHYRLKASMHAASMGEEWAFRAEEEAGITSLDQMSSAEERLATLTAIKLVSRHREAYWLQEYVERLLNTVPQQVFDCMVFSQRSEDASLLAAGVEATSHLFDVLILQLGSFTPYVLYAPKSSSLKRGDLIQCHLYRRYNMPQVTYILIPTDLDFEDLPVELSQQLTSKGRGGGSDETEAIIEEHDVMEE